MIGVVVVVMMADVRVAGVIRKIFCLTLGDGILGVGSGGGDSFCNGRSCNSCRSASQVFTVW